MSRVEWIQSALDELAAIWLRADSATRKAITAATHAIDGQLGANPGQQGESRDEGARIFFAPPLGLLFTVDAAQGVVTVLHVWLIRTRG